MKRFAANKIYLSSDISYNNAVIELSDSGEIINILSLSETLEIHSTPFFNGILFPIDNNQYVETPDYLNTLLSQIFCHKSYHLHDKISSLILLIGPFVLTTGSLNQSQTRKLISF